MILLQWLVAALTAIFVAAVAFLQWRTAQQKAVLDLFDRRFKIYETVKTCVYEANRNAGYFNEEREKEFLKVRDDAYFWFGNNIRAYERGRENPTTRAIPEGATVRSSHEEREALPVTSYEKRALSITRRRKRQRRPFWQTQWAIPARRADQDRDCRTAQIQRIAKNAPRRPDMNLAAEHESDVTCPSWTS